MNAKIGRPKANNPQSYEIRTRVDKDTYEKIEKFCKKNKITRSIFLRKGIEKVLNEK
jgi:putative uncharacterized protein FNV0124|nr:MAG TPA: Alginate and motility regulator [Caudoviricetes sp.]